MSLRARFEQDLANPNVRGTLAAIRFPEGTLPDPNDLSKGYDIMFTGRRFGDFSRHPRQVQRGGGYASDAAGAYQFLSTTWDEAAKAIGAKDFSPREQDLGALFLIRRRLGEEGYQNLVKNGLSREAVARLSSVWASLPTLEGKSYYGQPVKSFDKIYEVYNKYRQGAPSPSTAPPSAQSTGLATPPPPVDAPPPVDSTSDWDSWNDDYKPQSLNKQDDRVAGSDSFQRRLTEMRYNLAKRSRSMQGFMDLLGDLGLL